MAAAGLLVLFGMGIAGAGYALATTAKRLPEGQNPFDDFPPGVDGSRKLGVDNVTASSGTQYTVTAFRHADGRMYYVAQKRGDALDWISYFFDRTTGKRSIWHRNGDTMADIAGMLRDFDMGEQVGA